MKISISAVLIGAILIGAPTKFGFALETTSIGDDICSCAPSTYTFEFDFDLSCPPANVTVGDAVAETSCLTSSFGFATDLSPVVVQTISVFELDQTGQVFAQKTFVDSFGNGDTFTYQSRAANLNKNGSPNKIPKVIQISINGVNADGEQIINFFAITFTNSCTEAAYPVLFPGQSAGWLKFKELGSPSGEICPVAERNVHSAAAMLPTSVPMALPSDTPPLVVSVVSPDELSNMTPESCKMQRIELRDKLKRLQCGGREEQMKKGHVEGGGGKQRELRSTKRSSSNMKRVESRPAYYAGSLQAAGESFSVISRSKDDVSNYSKSPIQAEAKKELLEAKVRALEALLRTKMDRDTNE